MKSHPNHCQIFAFKKTNRVQSNLKFFVFCVNFLGNFKLYNFICNTFYTKISVMSKLTTAILAETPYSFMCIDLIFYFPIAKYHMYVGSSFYLYRLTLLLLFRVFGDYIEFFHQDHRS